LQNRKKINEEDRSKITIIIIINFKEKFEKLPLRAPSMNPKIVPQKITTKINEIFREKKSNFKICSR